ncbi:MAG: [NiFe] hydrogenase nickel incorporation protein HypA, partial [uncultured Solirubrobacteraceae bacterium]
ARALDRPGHRGRRRPHRGGGARDARPRARRAAAPGRPLGPRVLLRAVHARDARGGRRARARGGAGRGRVPRVRRAVGARRLPPRLRGVRRAGRGRDAGRGAAGRVAGAGCGAVEEWRL